MRLAIRTALIATMGATTLGLGAFPALAHGGGGYDDGGRYGGGYHGVRAASYINPDNGMPRKTRTSTTTRPAPDPIRRTGSS